MRKFSNYNEYLDQLKALHFELDISSAQVNIQTRIKQRSRAGRMMVAASLTVFLVGSLALFNLQTNLSGGTLSFSDYVFQQNSANRNSIAEYVFYY